MLTASHLLVESVLHSPGTLLVGDPQVLAQLELPAEPGIVPTPAGNAVVLHNPGASAFVWVAGSPEGPVRELTIALHLDALEEQRSLLGHLDCPSGRLVVGTPEAVAAWGDEIEPDGDLLAQARAYSRTRRHCGHVIVARVLPGRHRVLAVTGEHGTETLVVDCANTSSDLLLAG